jgi:hypothetical protein
MLVLINTILQFRRCLLGVSFLAVCFSLGQGTSAIRSNGAIAENPVGQQKLAQALAHVAEPVREAANAKTPRLARTVSGTTYSLSPNPLNLRTLQFQFVDQSSAEVTLHFDSETWAVTMGLDGKRKFAPVGPHGLSVATVGRWISDDEFLLDLDTVANVNHFLFSVHFDENKIRIRMNETTGEIKDVMVDGLGEGHPGKRLEQ